MIRLSGHQGRLPETALAAPRPRTRCNSRALPSSRSSCPGTPAPFFAAPARSRTVSARGFSLDKLLGGLLPDVGKAQRLAVVEKLYCSPTREKLHEVLSDRFVMGEEGFSRKFDKADYMGLLCDAVLPAIPDYSWSHACSGDVDRDGWLIVTVQASGHHTGAPLALPGLKPLPPSGKHFCLAEEIQRVRVSGGQVTEIEVLPNKGAGPRALYVALGGKLPTAVQPAGSAPPMP